MNATVIAPPVLPNAETSLAWLEPSIANQLEASRYLYCAVIGAWIWELLVSLPQEAQIYRRGKLGLADAVYIAARITSAGFIIGCLIFQLAPVGDCQRLETAIGWLGTCAVPFNCLLFFFRVRAVFRNSIRITIFFGLLWVSTLGCTITAAFGLTAAHIGTTKNCIDIAVKSYTSSGLVAAAVNDTLVFIAISYRLVSVSLADSLSGRLQSFLRGKHMGHISRVVLQTGQLYYFLTVSMNIVSMVVILSPTVPPIVRAMFTVPNVALQNTMACRVFRLLKLGIIRDNNESVTLHAENIKLASICQRCNTFATSQAQYSSTMEDTSISTAKTIYSVGQGNRVNAIPAVHIAINRQIEIDNGSLDRINANRLGYS